MDMDSVFNPSSVAVIGASNKEGSVGYGLFRNLSSFSGSIYPVNPNRNDVQGTKTYRSVLDIEGNVDMAVIAVPAKLVPGIIDECGERGVKACIVVSSEFKETGNEGKRLEEKIKKKVEKYGITLIGPNCLGVINTENSLNASFSAKMPNKGRTAVISQSGALGSAIIEWSLEQGVGIKSFISVGSMLDVDFGDLLKYFCEDDGTDGIIIYMESIKDARKFMDVAKRCVRKKPIVVLKAGLTDAGRKAAVSHTGSMAGNDDVYKAAFRQVGILQIDEIDDVFNCLRTLNLGKLPDGPGLAIVTNAGGAGVLSADAVQKSGGVMAKLSKRTIDELDSVMPDAWSKGNPVDVLGDASAEIYEKAIDACMRDKNVDGVLVVFTPQYASEPEKTAEMVGRLSKKHKKPLLSSWIGPEGKNKSTGILSKYSVSNYPTPERAVKAFIKIIKYKENLRLMEEVPSENLPKISPDRDLIRQEIGRAGNKIISESKSKEILAQYGIPVIETVLAKTPEEAAEQASRIGFPVALKVQSPELTHKSDSGGVLLYIHSKDEVIEGFRKIMDDVNKRKPGISIDGISVQKMVEGLDYELIMGSANDPDFGKIVLFGIGGMDAEIYNDKSIGLPPLNRPLARKVMEDTRIFRFLKEGYRNRKPVDMEALEKTMERLSYLVRDFPQINEIDINPLAIKEGKPVVLDARIILK